MELLEGDGNFVILFEFDGNLGISTSTLKDRYWKIAKDQKFLLMDTFQYFWKHFFFNLSFEAMKIIKTDFITKFRNQL